MVDVDRMRGCTAGVSLGLAATGCGGIVESRAVPVDAGESSAMDGSSGTESGSRDGVAADAAASTSPESGSCSSGARTIGANAGPSAMGRSTAIAVDSTSVYWVDDTTGILKVPLCGGTASTLAAHGPSTLPRTALAIDSASVYWLGSNGDRVRVDTVPLGGGATTRLTEGLYITGPLAVDATSLYLAQFGPDPALVRLPLGGGSLATMAPLATSSGSLDVGSLAVDATNAYWSQPSTGSVMSVPLAGGAPLTLATAQANPGPVTLDSANLYWANGGQWAFPTMPPGSDEGSIVKLPLAGGAPITLASGISPCGLATDGTSVYFTDFSKGAVNGQVLKVPVAGGIPSTIATPGKAPLVCPIAVDATSVYWGGVTTFDPFYGTVLGGGLMRTMPK